MRVKLIAVLSVCLVLMMGLAQAVRAEDATPATTIPVLSSAFSARLSPDGKTIATYDNVVIRDLKEVDPTLLPIRFIDRETGRAFGFLSGYTDYAADVVFTSDSTRLISIHMNGDLNIWDVATQKLIKHFWMPLLGYYMPIQLFADDKRALVLNGGSMQSLMVVDLETGAITQFIGRRFASYFEAQSQFNEFPARGDIQYAAMAISPDGARVAASTINDEVSLWTIADNQSEVVRAKSDKPALFNVRQIFFTPDGDSLVYFDGADDKVHVWDIAGKSEKMAVAVGADNFALSPDGTTVAWATRVQESPDTLSVARLDAPDKVAVWTLPDGLRVAPRMTMLNFTPDGKQVVVGGFLANEDVGNQIYVLDVPF